MTAVANFYNVELRDKAGYLKQYLTPYTKDVSWEWNRIGGCGRARIKLGMEYRKIEFNAGDDIQIRIRDLNNLSYDSFTKLLCHFDGADGSTADYAAETGQTVSLEGTAQLDTAQKKFGSASLLLDGDSDYVTLPDSADWDFGTGDFAVDTWVRFNVLQNTIFFDIGDYNNNFGTSLRFTSATHSTTIYLNGAGIISSTTWEPVINTWYHLAVTRSGTDLRMFVDGTQIGDTTADSTNITASNTGVFIGRGTSGATNYLDGWVDEFKISKGVARHTANFAPPMSAYAPDVATSKLVYRGWVAGVTPSLKVPQEITLDVRGYFDLLEFLVVQSNGDKETYSNQIVSDIVTDIVDTFITPNTAITKGTIDGAIFNVDSIQFKTKVSEALKTLAELEGNIEYGVDEDLAFFWRIESTTLRHKFFVGDNVEIFERRIDWSKLLNRIYFEGGDVGGSPYRKTAEVTDSQSMYFLAEGIVNNSSIITSAVADQYLSAKLRQGASPQLVLRFKIPNTSLRLEDTLPMGEVAVYDPDYDESLYIVGEAADGGSDLTVGLRADGGSNVTIGGVFQDQIERIAYILSETEGRLNLEITMGGNIDEAYFKIKQLELLLDNVRQNQ